MSTFANLIVEDRGPVRLVSIARPKAMNALNRATLVELKQVVSSLPDGVSAVVLQGAGEKAFVAGADLAEMVSFGTAEAIAFSELGHEVMRGLETLRVPVIGAVGGYCLGGGFELALACDFIVASTRAVFGLPEANVGVVPGFGGLRRLAKRIGIAATAQMAFTGARLRADEAKSVGIANEVVDPESLHPRVLELGQMIAEHAPLAIAEMKRALHLDVLSLDQKFYAEETAAFGRLFATADQKEGMNAFLEKREPRWTSR